MICHPLKARRKFTNKDYASALITLVCIFWLVFFLPKLLRVNFPMSYDMSHVVSAIILIAVSLGLFFFLSNRPIDIRCPSCGKIIETNTPWICGVCGAKNMKVGDFPFIGRCSNEKCRYEPKAYQCHHVGCGKLIFLSKDQSPINFARCINMPETRRSNSEKTVVDEHDPAKLERDIRIKELLVKKTQIDVQLKELIQTLQSPKQKTKAERLREGVKTRTEIEDEVKRLKLEADEEFAGDSEGLEKRYREIEDEARELL